VTGECKTVAAAYAPKRRDHGKVVFHFASGERRPDLALVRADCLPPDSFHTRRGGCPTLSPPRGCDAAVDRNSYSVGSGTEPWLGLACECAGNGQPPTTHGPLSLPAYHAQVASDEGRALDLTLGSTVDCSFTGAVVEP
jgi:hypothetical protein